MSSHNKRNQSPLPNVGHSHRNKRILGAILTVGILSVIFLPFQKAEAFVLEVSVPAVVNHTSAGVPFSATLEIAPGEFISIETITVLFDKDTPHEKTFVFDNMGKRISGSPGSMLKKLTISSSSPPYGYSYAYGYGLVSNGPVGSGSPIINGQIGGGITDIVKGFAGPTTITFNGILKTNKFVDKHDPTSHTVQVSIDTSAASTLQHLVSPEKSFTVNPKKISSVNVEGGGGSRTVKTDPLVGRGDVTITFSNVNIGGDIVVEESHIPTSDLFNILQKKAPMDVYSLGSLHLKNIASMGQPFRVDLSAVEDFSFPVDITIHYDEKKLPKGFNEQDLSFQVWTEHGWQDITVDRNPSQNTITGRLLS